MVALLVAMSVMAIALSVTLPVFQTMVRREREAELVFRGEQYARAIGLFQRKYGNALPPDLDVLVRERFLRKKYKDPITGEDFLVLGPGSPELAAALAAPPQQVQQLQQQGGGQLQGPGRGAPPAGQGTLPTPSTGRAMFQSPSVARPPVTQAAAGMTAGQQGGGGILAVTSRSTQSSIRLYNGKGHYNEWIFMALQASTAAGAPPGAGAPTPGGVGGPAPGGPTPRGGRQGIPGPGGPFGPRGQTPGPRGRGPQPVGPGGLGR